jgi:hypothetical protein
VAAGPGQDREVDHLDGEDEGGDEPGHRGRALVEVGPRTVRGDREAEHGDEPERRRGGGVHQPVAHVHGHGQAGPG